MLPLNPFLSHRNIECFGLERTFRGHLAQTPCSEVAQSPVQPGFKCFQGWGLHYLSGQPVPVFHHPHDKKFLPYIQSKSTLPSFKAITPCSIAIGPDENIFPIMSRVSPAPKGDELDLAHMRMRWPPQPAMPSRATKADLDTRWRQLAPQACRQCPVSGEGACLGCPPTHTEFFTMSEWMRATPLTAWEPITQRCAMLIRLQSPSSITDILRRRSTSPG